MSRTSFPVVGKYYFGWAIAFSLVISFVFGLVTGLSDSIRLLSSSWLFPFGLLAVFLGWFIGSETNNKKLYFVVLILLGPLLIIFIQSSVYQKLFFAFSASTRNLVACTYPCYPLPNPGPLHYYLYSALLDLSLYFTEIIQWSQTIITQQASVNQNVVNLIWGSFVWIVLFLMGWLLRRKHHALIASLPAFVLLSAVVGYTRQRSSGLIIALATLLALMVIVEHLKRENDWENHQIDYSEELRFTIISITVPVVFIIMVIAGFLPRLSLEELRTLLFNRQQHIVTEPRIDFAEPLGLEQAQDDTFTRVLQPGLPRSHLIGSGVELEERLIMEVDIGEVFLPPQIEPHQQPPNYYWFGSAYHIYMGSGWITEKIITETIPANQEISPTPSPGYMTAVHHFSKSDAAARTLYHAGMLNAVDQNFTLAWHETQGEYFTAQLDFTEYRVKAFIQYFSEEDLQQADQQPPENIIEKYLQIPDEIPERVKELALNITSQANGPYDQAKIIETFLRQYEYSLDLPDPPQDQDLVDYFLFDLQQGYCDYFASAMVVLARVNGLPTRLAVGYTTGTYDFAHQKFVVTEANAHAWPEIYIEPFGWIPFEPTASLSVRSWTTLDETTPAELPLIPGKEEITTPDPIGLEIFGLVILILLTLISGLVWFQLHRRKINPPSTTLQIQTIYQKLLENLSSCLFTLEKELTPREVCLIYTQHLNEIPTHGIPHKTTVLVSNNLAAIINLYEKGIYSRHKLSPLQVRNAQKHLNRTRLHALLIKAIGYFIQALFLIKSRQTGSKNGNDIMT